MIYRKDEPEMPNPTFFNLDEKKQDKIIAAALEEFAANSFAEASVAGIIEKAEIPRGSFYQYFTDLEDLYIYLLKKITERKINFIKTRLSEMEDSDTFTLLHQLYKIAVEFVEHNPRLAAVSNNFLKEDRELQQQVYEAGNKEAVDFYKMIINRGLEREEIDSQVEVELLAGVLKTLNIYLMEQYLAGTGREKHLENMEDYLARVDQALYIIENGIRR